MTNIRSMATLLRFLSAMIVGLGLLCPSRAALAAATITAGPAGNGVYAVTGTGLSGVAGLDLTVTYDTATLGNPRIDKGGLLGNNAIFATNPNQPGIIRIGILNPNGISGNGTIVTITFDRKGDSSGLLTGLSATMINANSAPLPVVTSYSNASSGETPQTAQTDTSSGSPSGSGGGGGSGAGTGTGTGAIITSGSGATTYLGTVTMPGESPSSGQQEKKAEAPKYDQQPPQGQTSSSAGQGEETARSEPAEKKAPVEKKNVSYPSVAEKVKALQDKLTVEKLIAAFEPARELPYLQAPPIVLSDGSASVRITLRLGSDAKESPSFALEHAKLLSLKQSDEGDWIVEALPVKNANEATMTVAQGESTTRIPLTVAQPLSEKQLAAFKPLTEKSVQSFLKERGTKDAPRFDLNGDGKRDYLDDYIFAANYLVLRPAVPAGAKPPVPPPAAPKKP